MDSKNYTQVLIDGRIYTLGGSEDEAYLQKAAGYVNDKNTAMRKLPGFSKQSADYQMVMTELNMADDYFKALERAEETERRMSEMEKESYSLKHELVSTQMKLEAVLKDLEERQAQLEELRRRAEQREGEQTALKSGQTEASVKVSEEITVTETSAAETPKDVTPEPAQTRGTETAAPAAPEAAAAGKESETELIGKAMQAARRAGHRGRR